MSTVMIIAIKKTMLFPNTKLVMGMASAALLNVLIPAIDKNTLEMGAANMRMNKLKTNPTIINAGCVFNKYPATSR